MNYRDKKYELATKYHETGDWSTYNQSMSALNQELFKDLFDYINNISGTDFEKDFIPIWKGAHRTLQESFFRGIVIKLIKHVNECNGDRYFDGRNEDMKTFCDKVIESCSERELYMSHR